MSEHPDLRRQPATEPADVAYTAAMEALAQGADMAEWFVHLMSAVAVSPDVADGELPFLRRTGSWEAAGVRDLVESNGTYYDPSIYAREERPLLHDMSLLDVIRWTVPGLRELYGDAIADLAAALADEVDAAWTAKFRDPPS